MTSRTIFTSMSDKELFSEWKTRCDTNDLQIRLAMIERNWIDNHGNRVNYPTHLEK